IDRKSLVPPSIEQYKSEYIAPQTDEEIKIVNAFEKILNIKNIGLNDDFFMLGGDSIKTIMLLEECNLGLSPADIMIAKTPKNIAELIKNNETKTEIKHYDFQAEYELTDSEKGVYLEWQQDKTKTAYNIPCCFGFKKSIVKSDALKNAVINFVNNHNALKSNFINKNGEIKKLRNDEKPVEVIISKTNETEIADKKKNFVKPFDLEKDDLFRFEICETENKIYLLSDIHHIVTDGTSVAIMLNDIKNSLLGIEVEKEEITSFDLNIYEKELKNSEKYKKSKDFFERKFLDKELTQSLPSDVYKNSLISEDTEYSLNFDDEICSSNIKEFLNKNGLTENTFFMGAFAYCISKYLNEEEITIRSVNNGRFNKNFKNTVGMLVRTLPLVYKIDETIKIKEFLKEVQSDFYKTIDNSDFTYMDFVNNTGINPDLMFVYQSDMLNGFEINNEIIELEELENKDLISNFSAMVFKSQNKYKINLKYNNQLYTKNYIKYFLNFYNQVLKEFLHKETLKDIELVNADDKELIKSFSKQRKVIDESKTFVDLFKKQVEKTPDNIALVYQQNKYTYKQLDEITDRLAKYLISKGVKPNEYVGIYINRSEFMQISAIGVLKSGAAYQPLDSKNPIDRLNFMIENSETKFVITSEDLENTIAYNGEKLLIENILSLPNLDIELPKINKDDKFVLLYTSGSTGMPKGVELLHRNLTNYIGYYKDFGKFSENTKCFAYASFGFDAHMSDVYATFISGGTVFVASDEMKLNIVDLHKYLLKNKINFLFTPTQFMKQYISMFPDNPYIENFYTGGEKMPNIELPKYNLYNAYGPTECTIFSSAFLLEKNLNFIPIGHTFGNNTSYIVDKYQRLLPVGATGELYIAGAQVGKGYLKRDDLNKDKFIDNPYDNEFEKLYKSGDICRYLPDGNIDIIGRKDFQVKIRGFRIELTEIENKILEFKDIKDATVIAKDSPSGGKYVVAYIVSDKNIEIKELNDFIKKSLPAYMVPEVTMQINEIPHNVNGKVDKRKLPEPIKTEKEKTNSAPKELNFIEKIISEILKESLGHNDFDVMTNFVEAGMTSITAMKFSA
ncbi:MAG: amino acid adenylation domain-containing protein, partial [bacterium]|nr:amino acid adenylation domain-containing protein [bacterium]